MFGQVYNIVGSTQVEEHNNIVSIKGFPTRSFQHSISKMWGNTAIGKFMFRSDNSGEVSMDSFFIPDLVYLIERLYSSPKARVSRQSLKRVEEAIWKDTWFKSLMYLALKCEDSDTVASGVPRRLHRFGFPRRRHTCRGLRRADTGHPPGVFITHSSKGSYLGARMILGTTSSALC